jgi:hypothetical protein
MSALRKKADAVARAASVGIVPQIHEADLFGGLQLTELGSAVRSLEGNPEGRTVHRLFWPLTESEIPLIFAGVNGQDPNGASSESLHVRFLTSWYRFLRSASPTDAADALESCQAITESSEVQSAFAAFLLEEDGVTESNSQEIVRGAIKTATLAVLERVSVAAADAWDNRDTSYATQLARVVLDSPTDDELEERALGPLANCGWRLHERVSELIEEMPAYHDGFSVDEPREVVQLVRLGQLLSGRHPSATDWVKSSEKWRTGICWRMRNEALRLYNNEDKTAEALLIAQKAFALATNSAQKEKLKEEVTVLESFLREEKQASHFRSISKISSAPPLRTINGWGTTLYGRQPFEGDKEYYFSTLYFVGFFIPIFPITRYLVKDASPEGWTFLGKSPWSKWMKLHLAFSILAIIYVFYTLQGSGSTVIAQQVPSEPLPTYSSAVPTAQSESVEYPSAKPSESIASAYPEDPEIKRRERLQSELDSLKSQIEGLDSSIGSTEAELNTAKSNLEGLNRRIDATSPDRYSQDEVDAFNSMVRKHERLRRNYNAKVEDFNGLILKRKRKVSRHNEVVNALNER